MSDIMDRLLDTTDRDAVSDAREEIAALRAEVEGLTGERDRQYDQNAEQIIRIAALEAENERLKGFEAANRLNAAQVKAQRAENERLREFVLFVDKWTNYKPNKPEKPTSYEDCVKTIAPMAREFARAALEGKP